MTRSQFLIVLIAMSLVTAACTRQRTDAVPSTTPTSTTQATTTSVTAPPIAEDPLGLDRRTAPAFDPVEWRIEHGLITPEEVVIPPRPRAEVGAIETFKVSGEFDVVEIEAELVAATDQIAMWVERGVPADPAEYQFAATVLTDEILPALTDLFGPLPQPGVDGDGRIDVLHVSTLGATSGEFGASDLLPVAVAPESNQRELLYVSLAAATVGSDLYLATLAHELQHLIDAGIRPNTPLWLSEGLAQLAERIAGYDSVHTGNTFLATTPVQLNTWGPLQLDDRYYGAAYLFNLYVWERFGDELVAAIASSPYDGLAAIDAALADVGTTVEAVFADWAVANYLDQPDPDPRFGYTTDDLRAVCPVERIDALPATIRDSVDQFSARYHILEGEGPLHLEFAGSETTGPIPDLPHRGQWMWWSGRSDNSASRLTRAFDLSGLSRATLEFRIWYDTGLGDHATVSVSTDGGSSWTALEGRHTTPPMETFPIPSYTGTSGRGEKPVWVGDQIDLTPYAGGEVLIRFEYVTDLYENRAGLALDEIEIPELGYVDGAEQESDWLAEGFLRSPGTLAQPWIVRIVDPGAAGVVTDVAVEDGRGSADIVLDAGNPVAVIVAPAQVANAVPATYELTFEGAALLTVPDPSIDALEDPCAGWEVETEPTYSLAVGDGRLTIDLHEPDVFTWSTREGYFEDVTVAATVTFGVGAGSDGAAGLMCRASNAGFYDFEISADGFVFGGVAFGDGYDVLSDWAASDAVSRGAGAENHLELRCTGDRIQFLVNGTTVIDLTDGRLVGGEVALSAASFEESGYSVTFTDVYVTGPVAADLPGVVLFSDFTDGPGDWSTQNRNRGVLEVADGAYQAIVRPANWGVEGFAGVAIDDVIVDVDVRVLENSPDGSITISCRNQPDGDQYLFLVGLDGFTGIASFIGGEFELLADWSITSQLSAAVGDTNHLRAECTGPDLLLAANGVEIARAADDRLRGGDIGLGLMTFEHGNYRATFDNVLIRSAG